MLSISTKTGDQGMSGLANGQRVNKDCLIMEVIGTLDELNSWLGVAIADLDPLIGESAILATQRNFLFSVQETLFVIGAQMAQSPRVKLSQTQLTKLERQSQKMQQTMKKGRHTKFLLPGGHPLAARLDVARTVCRRCERRVVALSRERKVANLTIKYLNRLSDYLYVLRCLVNAEIKYHEKLFIHTEVSAAGQH